MSDLKDYPHISRFEDIPISYASSLTEKNDLIAKASLDNLKNLLPDYRVNLDKNIDLLGIAFNAAVVNVANKNGDIMDTQTAIYMADTFGAKFLNKEHKRDKIIGHIVNAGFSSYGESNILYSMDIAETKDPFNIALGAVVYKIVDRDYAAQIEDSADSESPNFQKLSASWEVGMPNFRIAMGSPNLKDAEIIDNPKQIEELKKYLSVYGGSGKYGNSPVYRLIGRECLALGCAITSRPAAAVEGFITRKKPEDNNQEATSRATFFGGLFNNSDKTKKTSVTQNIPNMEKLELILEEIKASMIANKVKEESIANVVKDFADKIKEANEGYLTQINESKAAREKAEKESAEIKASLDTQAKELAETKEKLVKLESDSQAKASAELFSARMAEFDAEFDLDEEDKKALAADIKALDNSDESFAAFKGKMNVFMKDKNKKAKEEKAKEAKASIDKLVAEKLAEVAKASGGAKLSDKELAEKALEQAKASAKGVIPNNNGSQGEQKSLREKYAAAFSKENVTISK